MSFTLDDKKSPLQKELESFCLEALDSGLTGKHIIEFMVDQAFPHHVYVPIDELRSMASRVYDHISDAYTDDL